MNYLLSGIGRMCYRLKDYLFIYRLLITEQRLIKKLKQRYNDELLYPQTVDTLEQLCRNGDVINQLDNYYKSI